MKASCWNLPLAPYKPNPKHIRVVLPVCKKDMGLMLHNLKWQRELDVRKDYDCVLSLDGSLTPDEIVDIESAAWDTFEWVETYVYPTAPRSSWPQAPNWAFQHTARHMKQGNRPWFWMEADCVPLQPDWLDALNAEYFNCRKPMMGVVVQGMGHCNGTAIYPPNFCDISRKAMRCVDVAWDGEMKSDTIHLTHNVPHLMCHVWGIKNGRAVPSGGDAAIFKNWSDVKRWVDLKAVVFHRSKNETLINQLRIYYDNRHNDSHTPERQAVAGMVPEIHP